MQKTQRRLPSHLAGISSAALLLVLSLSCGDDDGETDASVLRDAGSSMDASVDTPSNLPDSGPDSSRADASQSDAGALDSSLSDASSPDSSRLDSSTSAGGLSEVLTRAMYDAFFLHRDNAACEGELFTYDALIAAAATFPEFCTEGSMDERRREAAAFLANVSHETTGGWSTAPDGPYAWGLCFKEEVGCGDGSCMGYCASSAMWSCAPGQTYHGRGPMQLSWNYNYGQAGEDLGLDLINQPNLITSNGTVAFRTAIWFWMTPQSPKPSCHDVMVGAWTPSAADRSGNREPGFGMTVNIINGGLECNRGPDSRVDDRIGFYRRYADLMGVDPGTSLDCATMTSY